MMTILNETAMHNSMGTLYNITVQLTLEVVLPTQKILTWQYAWNNLHAEPRVTCSILR